jgi:hypothetical protein
MKRRQQKASPLPADGNTKVSDRAATLAELIALARELSPLDRLRLIEALIVTLEHDWPGQAPAPRRSLYGLWRDLEPTTASDIDEARGEAWANFPREDVP